MVPGVVDTGATISVISENAAKSIGAQLVRDAVSLDGVYHAIAIVEIRVDATGCGWRRWPVVVSNGLAARAGPDASMIVGHDYLQQWRGRLVFGPMPADHDFECRPKSGARKRRKLTVAPD